MKRRLTTKQLTVLVYIKEFFRENGYIPNRTTLSAHFGWTPDNGQEYLAQLTRRGYIEHLSYGIYRFPKEQEMTA